MWLNELTALAAKAIYKTADRRIYFHEKEAGI